jgi:hypothetical protein
MDYNVHTCIITANNDRKKFMETQFNSIEFPFKYNFFNAFTPDTLIDYIDMKDTVEC